MSKSAQHSQSTIRNKLSRKMFLQGGMIAAVAILSIGFASVVIEQLLVREALVTESDHFWLLHDQDPAFPTPNTNNLKGYLTSSGSVEGVPAELVGRGQGFHKMHGQFAHSLLYTSEHNGKTLYLLFDGKSVLRLAIYFGVLPLTIVLLLIYLTAWWIYRESNYFLSPIVWLANKFDKFDPAEDSASLEDLSDVPGNVDWEVEKLFTSFRSYSTRIKRFVERERAFTRDASHEFRTPLTVIKMAADLLLSEEDLNEYSRKYATRIKGSAQDMEELIDAFLILARETDLEFEEQRIVVADTVAREIKSASIYLDDKPVVVEIDEQYPLELYTARKALSIVLGNLIRNAILYTNDGSVTVTLRKNSVEVADTGIGMCDDQVKQIFQPYYRARHGDKTSRKGYGVGLTIVKRLVDRFNWVIKIDSELNVGTKVEVFFSE